MKDNLQEKVCFWNKGDIINLMLEYELCESERDLINFSYLTSKDELLEFACFLLCGGWGDSRNFSVLDEETKKDNRIKRMFDYLDGVNC